MVLLHQILRKTIICWCNVLLIQYFVYLCLDPPMTPHQTQTPIFLHFLNKIPANKIPCKGAKLLNPNLFSRYDSSRIWSLYVWGKIHRHDDDNDDNDTETPDPVQTQIPSHTGIKYPVRGIPPSDIPRAADTREGPYSPARRSPIAGI